MGTEINMDTEINSEATEIDVHVKMSKYIQAVRIVEWCLSQTGFGSERYEHLIELRDWVYGRVGMCATAIAALKDKEGKEG